MFVWVLMMSVYLQMASAPKRFKQTCVRDVYTASYEAKFEWKDLLPSNLLEYFNLFFEAYNCPLGVSVSSTLGVIAAICGPKVSMAIRPKNFEFPLNSYIFVIAAPGGG